MRHLFEGRRSRWGGFYSRSLCGKRYYGRHPVVITRQQDEAAPLCSGCAAVQARRLAKAWKAKEENPRPAPNP